MASTGQPVATRAGPRIAALCALAALCAALWWAPVQQARVGPAARAEAFVALTICKNRPATGVNIAISELTGRRPLVTSHTPAQVADLASPFVPHFARGWRMELAAVGLAALGVVALTLMPVTGAVLALASLAAFLSLHGLNFEGYTLIKVAGIGHWVRAISAWDSMMFARLLLTPVAFVLVAWVALLTLWTALRERRRQRSADPQPTPFSTDRAART